MEYKGFVISSSVKLDIDPEFIENSIGWYEGSKYDSRLEVEYDKGNDLFTYRLYDRNKWSGTCEGRRSGLIEEGSLGVGISLILAKLCIERDAHIAASKMYADDLAESARSLSNLEG